MEPLPGGESVSMPVCAGKKRDGPSSANQGFLQLATTPAMEGDTHPSPPIPLFLLVQNLFSKQIVPTDNMWPEFDDDYS